VTDSDGLVSFWLVPAEETAVALARTIDALCATHDAPHFAPHITVFSRHDPSARGERAHIRDVARRAVAGVRPFVVRCLGVGHTDDLFKTVFLRIAPAAELDALQGRVRAELRRPGGYALDPHLSLIYKSLPREKREEIAAEIRPPAPFVCDRLAVVVPGPAGWIDIAGWTAVDCLELRG
jgi:hypothetical protein